MDLLYGTILLVCFAFLRPVLSFGWASTVLPSGLLRTKAVANNPEPGRIWLLANVLAKDFSLRMRLTLRPSFNEFV